MGCFDEMLDGQGRRWQTKDGFCEMRVFHPGDLFPAERVVSWIELVGDDDNGGYERAVGLVFDGVWTGVIGNPEGTGYEEVVAASRALVLLMKVRMAEITTERDRARADAEELRVTDHEPTALESEAAFAVLRWAVEQRSGISSEWLAAYVVTGERLKSSWGQAHPRDADDAGRCLTMLRCLPADFRAVVRARVETLCADDENWARWRDDLLTALDEEGE